MTTSFSDITYWGYSLDEYRRMFDLHADDLKQPMLDCAAGPASFNAEFTAMGGEAVSVDPLYQRSSTKIAQASEEAFTHMLTGLKDNAEYFVWKTFSSPEHIVSAHKQGLQTFLDDFEQGKEAGRYVAQSLPHLSFNDFQFNIALCSHFFFLHPDYLSVDFHVQAIKELCRVATELRIFPLLDENGDITALVGPVMLLLQQAGFGVEIREVPYQLRKNGNAMMRVWSTTCDVPT